MVKTTAQIQQEITAGERLATKVKEYFYPDIAWTPKLAWDVGVKMRDIKRAALKFYVDRDIISILHELSGFNKQDLEDLLTV